MKEVLDLLISNHTDRMDATQIAEVLWLSQFLPKEKPIEEDTSSLTNTSKTLFEDKRKNDLLNDIKNKILSKDEVKNDLPKDVTHTIVISSQSDVDNDHRLDFKIAPVKVQFKQKLPFINEQFKLLEIQKKKPNHKAIDEEKMVEYIADTNILYPFFNDERVYERYFDLNMIIDTNNSMLLWDDAITHFIESVMFSAYFKKVEIYEFDSSSETIVFRNRRTKSVTSLFKSQQTLNLVFTDAIGKAWRSNQMYMEIDKLSKYALTTIVSMLPKYMWQRTSLRRGSSEFMKATKTFPKNRNLISRYYFVEEKLSKNKNSIRIPIIHYDESFFEYFSKLVLNEKDSVIETRVFEDLQLIELDDSEEPIDAKIRVERFFNSAVTATRELAIYCSVIPLNKSLIQELIHVKNLGDNMDIFAEFYFSGLLDRKAKAEFGDYEFYNGVRKELLQYISMESTQEIFSLLSGVIKQSLGVKYDLSDFLDDNYSKDEALRDNEKGLVELLIEILGEKGKFYKNRIESLQDTIDTVYLETNSFLMGSNAGYDDEKPVHRITFNYDFEVAKTPITFEEYDLYCEDKNINKPSDEGWGRGKRPVINVSLEDAQSYCKWLSKKTAKEYRLPTEAEWEYACRAGTETKWSFGNEDGKVKKYGWYGGNSNGRTHDVATKKENPWGIYDMHGNVWEWCQDDWVDNYNDTPRDGTAYKKSKDFSNVIRGGGWDHNASFTIQTSRRRKKHPNFRFNDVSFRLFRTLPSNENNNFKKEDIKNIDGDVTFNCNKCHKKHSLNCTELVWEIVESHERDMGVEYNHEANYEKECDVCNNSMSLTFNCWEYPMATEETRDVNGEGVENISGDCCLALQEQYSDESNYHQDYEEKAIEKIKNWFSANYEDPAERLPYITKEGGYQWIHGGPINTGDAVHNNFMGEYSEEILEQAIDEIGRYEEWSPIPQSEDEFQESLGLWARKKADEDES